MTLLIDPMNQVIHQVLTNLVICVLSFVAFFVVTFYIFIHANGNKSKSDYAWWLWDLSLRTAGHNTCCIRQQGNDALLMLHC